MARFRRWKVRLSATVAGGAVIAFALASVVTMEASASRGGPGKPHRAADLGPQPSMANFPAQAAAFVAFRRAANATDAQLAADQIAPGPAVAGAAPTLVRSVYSDSSVTLGIYPAVGQLCFVAVYDSGGTAQVCDAVSRAAGEGLGVVSGDATSGFYLWGVLPDGSSNVTVTDASGDATHVTLSDDNGYAFRSNIEPVSFSFTDSAGVVHKSALYFGEGAPSRSLP